MNQTDKHPLEVKISNVKMIGIVRCMDKLGRIVIPKEYRNLFGLTQEVKIEMLACDQGVLIRPYGYKPKK